MVIILIIIIIIIILIAVVVMLLKCRSFASSLVCSYRHCVGRYAA